MKLERLTVRRLPGIDRTLSVEPALDRPTVIIGPNASGKSSLVRALRALLHPASAPDFVDLDARFDDHGTPLEGRALGGAREWQRDGETLPRSDWPDWPDRDQLDAFLIHADELLDTGAAEAGIADALRRLLAGGFDLDAVRQSKVFALQSKPRGDYKEHEKRLAELDQLERRQADLSADVDRLDRLREERDAARSADARRQAAARALETLEQQRTLDHVRHRLEVLGPGFDRLDGKEGERLGEIEDALDERKQKERAQRRTLETAQAELDASGIDDLDAAEDALAALLDELRRWETLNGRRRALDQELERAETARREAGRRVGARGPETTVVPDLEAVDALDDAATHMAEIQRDLDRLGREQAAIADVDDPGPELDRVRDAGRALGDWQSTRPPAPRFWVLNGAGLVVLLAAGLPWTGLVPAEYGLPLPAGWEALRPLLLGAAAGPLALLLAGALRANRARAICRRFDALGVAAPSAWQPAAVAERSEALDQQRADLVLRRRQWERGVDRSGDIEQAERRLGEARAAWAQACIALGLDPDETDASASHRYRLRELHDLQRAQRQGAEARAALEVLAEETAELVARVADHLQRLPDEGPTPDRFEALAERLRPLERRIAKARKARDDLKAARVRIEEIGEDRDAIHDRLERLYAAAGLRASKDESMNTSDEASEAPSSEVPTDMPNDLRTFAQDDTLHLDLDDDLDLRFELDAAPSRPSEASTETTTIDPMDRRATLVDRLRLLPDWRRLDDERKQLERAIAAGHQALDETPDLAAWVKAGDTEALEAAHDEARRSSERLEPLIRDIERIELEQQRALDERELEALNAERERLRDRLADAREDRLFAAAGGFLLERAQAHHVARHQPDLLKRAKDWFGRFTHAGWALEFDGQDFAARDLASGEQRALQQLSTATRIQLLLALRLAWIDEIARDRCAVPIILDEVLATSDPSRYQAVVEAGAELVRSGRQLIYLSAQAADVEAWTRFHAEPTPKVIQLAPVASDAAFRFAPDAPLLCPDPEMEPADWAKAAEVPALDPFAPAERIALFHLAPYRLDDLNALRTRRIVTLGQFEQAQALGTLPLDPEAIHLFEARIRATHAWLKLWQRGHTHPVTAETIHESEAVSETFIGDVVDLNRELNGDGPKLIEALRDGRVKGFRSSKIDDLATYLDAAGCLTPDRRVTDDELITTLIQSGPLGDALAERLDAWLRAGVASFE